MHTEVDAHFEPLRHKGNSYMIDREAQSRGESFTGIRGIREQDLAVQEDQRGPLSAREQEHLGTADLGVISTRRRLQPGAGPDQRHRAAEPHRPEVPRALGGVHGRADDGLADGRSGVYEGQPAEGEGIKALPNPFPEGAGTRLRNHDGMPPNSFGGKLCA